jgi:hypothetical protein
MPPRLYLWLGVEFKILAFNALHSFVQLSVYKVESFVYCFHLAKVKKMKRVLEFA